MSEARARTVGLIGLGRMGERMACRLLQGGFRVLGFDRDADARRRLAADGGVAVPTAGAAVTEADVLILMLPDSDAVESVLGQDDVVGDLSPNTVVVDMSSSEPQRTRALAATLGARGVAMIDAPVSGGVTKAEAGTLAIMVGGDDATAGAVEDILACMGTVFRAGPVGAGHAVKALNNLMSATHLLATSEAMVASIAFGLDPEVVLGIVNASSGRSGSTENKWPNFVVPGTFHSGFALALMLKDMRIALGLAEQVGAPHELAAQAVDLWAQASSLLPSGADHTEIARWIQQRVGGPAHGRRDGHGGTATEERP